jgi:precorrin-6A synthase
MGELSGSRRILVIGIGAGAPDQLTGAARAALDDVAYVVAADKGDADPLLGIRRDLCRTAGVPLVAVPDPVRDRGPADYPAAVADWHAARVAAYLEVLAARPGDVGFLVWGDPSLYDSTLRIVEQLAAALPGTTYRVVPGLSAPQLLAAAHGIVLHPVGAPVLVSTGRRLGAELAGGATNVAVMLDGALACLDAAVLPDPEHWWIWWGANLGTTSERLVAGGLAAVADQLRAARAEAAAAAGWVMDTYLLRRVGPVDTVTA